MQQHSRRIDQYLFLVIRKCGRYSAKMAIRWSNWRAMIQISSGERARVGLAQLQVVEVVFFFPPEA